jgi:hypothetical protein
VSTDVDIDILFATKVFCGASPIVWLRCTTFVGVSEVGRRGLTLTVVLFVASADV